MGVTEHGDGSEHKFPVTQHAGGGFLTWVGAGEISNVRKYRRGFMEYRQA